MKNSVLFVYILSTVCCARIKLPNETAKKQAEVCRPVKTKREAHNIESEADIIFVIKDMMLILEHNDLEADRSQNCYEDFINSLSK
jgi:propanediol dehydratase small subunit